ncbi:MAG TPA: copper transporter [Thermoleophilaceae bacterium]
MLDFRYHALSLVAVFLALGIGILLGTTIGDQLVSEANRDLSSSLRQDVIEARRTARGASDALEERERFIASSFDRIAGERLRGRSVALVSSGKLPGGVESGVRDAVQDGGGELSGVAEFAPPTTLPQIGEAIPRRFEGLLANDPRTAALGRAIGRGVAEGGVVPRRLADRFPERFRGEFPRIDAVVYFRDPAADRNEDQDRFEQGLIDGLGGGGVPIVGVETLETDPSQIGFYEDRMPASVDNVDTPSGRIALVLGLAGARGSFGFKGSADAPLPEPRGR